MTKTDKVNPRKNSLEIFLLLLPFLIWFLIFVLYPSVNCFVLSFREQYNLLTQTSQSVGLGNYSDVIGDPYFRQALRNTAAYSLITVPLAIILSLAVSWILCSGIRFSGLFQSVIFMPMVTSVSAVGYAWRLMFHDRYGVINYVLELSGFSSVRWTSDPSVTLIVMVIYGVWAMLPSTILFLVNDISSIPLAYTYAARADGANTIRRFTRIILPNIRETVLLLVFTNTITAIKTFDNLYPFFSGKPGPTYNFYTVVYYIYANMQGPNIYGYGRAAAAAVILLAILSLIMGVFLCARKMLTHG